MRDIVLEFLFVMVAPPEFESRLVGPRPTVIVHLHYGAMNVDGGPEES